MLYIHLFHGRKTVNEDMNDWGEDGPVIGPVDYFHLTYGNDIKLGDDLCNLHIDKTGLLYFDGMYYGDFSVLDGQTYLGGLVHGDWQKSVPMPRWNSGREELTRHPDPPRMSEKEREVATVSMWVSSDWQDPDILEE